MLPIQKCDFHSYVKLPEGIYFCIDIYFHCQSSSSIHRKMVYMIYSEDLYADVWVKHRNGGNPVVEWSVASWETIINHLGFFVRSPRFHSLHQNSQLKCWMFISTRGSES